MCVETRPSRDVVPHREHSLPAACNTAVWRHVRFSCGENVCAVLLPGVHIIRRLSIGTISASIAFSRLQEQPKVTKSQKEAKKRIRSAQIIYLPAIALTNVSSGWLKPRGIRLRAFSPALRALLRLNGGAIPLTGLVHAGCVRVLWYIRPGERDLVDRVDSCCAEPCRSLLGLHHGY